MNNNTSRAQELIGVGKATLLLPIVLIGLGFIALKDVVRRTNRVAEILDGAIEESKLPQ